MPRSRCDIERDLSMQRTNLGLAMAEPMRAVILGRIDRLLDELLEAEGDPA